MIRRAAIAAGALLLVAAPASALDKQGSAHGGTIEGPTSGFAMSGSAGFGVALYNPTYAARPDNTGLMLLRGVTHLDIDLVGRRLSIPVDLNVFSDRRARPGARVLVPSELDAITGLITTWRLGPGALEGGARVEHDRALDRGGYARGVPPIDAQTYVDARARYLLSAAALAPGIADALWDGDLSGWLTLGWFAVNEAYFARPDNTGLALFRYAAHSEVAVWKRQLAFGVDGTFFTDRRAANAVRPSELDLTLDLIARPAPFELHLAYERDMPIDRGGLVQQLLYALAVISFDIVAQREAAATTADSRQGRR